MKPLSPGQRPDQVLVVRARSEGDGIEIDWPTEVERQGELSTTIELFCRRITELPTLAVPDLPPGHPHRAETAALVSPSPIRYVELFVGEGLGFASLHEPSAAERRRGATVSRSGRSAGDDSAGAPMTVQSFQFGPGLPDAEPAGPERPWPDFRAALLAEARRRRPT